MFIISFSIIYLPYRVHKYQFSKEFKALILTFKEGSGKARAAKNVIFFTMPEEKLKTTSAQRLAAIMFTDIVGYTKLMGSDEDKAFQILRQNRAIHSELIEKFGGSFIKEMGDGILAQFDSASEAVRCAKEIQFETRRTFDHPLRIGIHLGEVTFENQDVFGDGVNIASRLQAIALPGGIYISESTQKTIKSKSDIQTIFIGPIHLKNVDYLVNTYAIQGDGLPEISRANIRNLRSLNWRKQFTKFFPFILVVAIALIAVSYWLIGSYSNSRSSLSSLLILPFDNFTGNDSLEYFVSGMHSSLIGDIGRIGALNVKSTTTSRAYKESQKSISDIASELNVNAVVEASVMCIGDSICLQVRLISTESGEELLWVQDFREEKSQVLNLYNKITREISQQIKVALTREEHEFLAESKTIDPEAYDAFLKGQYYWEKVDPAYMQMSLDYFQLAIDIDKEWADPYAGLANAWGVLGMFGVVPTQVSLPNVKKHLDKALALDPNSAQAHYVNAITAVWLEWDWEKGGKEFLRSIELNANDALCRLYYAHLLMILRRPEEAVHQANLGLELDPLRPLVLSLYGVVMTNERDYSSAISHFKKALSIDPNFAFAKGNLYRAIMNEAYAKGNHERWIEAWDQKVKEGGKWHQEARMAVRKAFREQGFHAAIEEMLNMNRQFDNCYMDEALKAERYLFLGDYDQWFDYMEKAIEKRSVNASYMATDMLNYEFLKDQPRYTALLKKMNLPLID